MRIVCSFVGGAGHLLPQVPLLRALHQAGHELALVGRTSGARSAPPGLFARIDARPDRRAQLAAKISPLVPVDREAEVAVVADHFAGAAARESARAVDAWLGDADVVVCDELDFGAMAAATRADLPIVVVSVIASGALVRARRDHRGARTLASRARSGASDPASRGPVRGSLRPPDARSGLLSTDHSRLDAP